MGGISQGTMRREAVDGRPALRIEGDVSLENNGGFLQIALDLARGGRTVDAGGWIWIETDALGPEVRHLRVGICLPLGGRSDIFQ